jgi:hypothetical protein
VTEDRRRAARYPCTVASLCEFSPSIHPQETTALGHWEGQVLNLSATGIGVLLGRRFERGTVVPIVLENPARTFRIRADVQVVRSLRSEGNQWFLGAAFTKPLEKRSLRKLLWTPPRQP